LGEKLQFMGSEWERKKRWRTAREEEEEEGADTF
jgi:hypothetical protein